MNEYIGSLKRNKIRTNKKVLRVAKYIRVSTDEQKMKRNSIDAQHEILDQFIADNDHLELVGTYADEGVSGTKFNRTELQRLLADVESGKIDLIVVTKLDRWFRDVSLFYKTQEILDANGAAWFTVLEDYETLTSDGRFKVNIMLSVYQNEVDRTSERIKVVFDYKVKHGQAVSGSLPLGFKTIKKDNYKIVVHDPETEHIVIDFLQHYEQSQSIRETTLYLNYKYNLKMNYRRLTTLIKNTLLYGSYRGNDNYCEPYISKEKFNELNKILKTKNIKSTVSKRVYIFSGLLKCKCCGGNLTGKVTITPNKDYYGYRCNKYINSKGLRCSKPTSINETKLEDILLNELRPQFEKLALSYEIDEQPINKAVNVAEIEEEKRRLNMMYKKGRIDDDEYDREYEKLENKLNECKINQPKHNLDAIKGFLNQDINTIYMTLSKEEKRTFWRSIIDYIEFTEDNQPIIHFL